MDTAMMRYYFEAGLWDLSRLDKLLAAGKITEAQYTEIVGGNDRADT